MYHMGTCKMKTRFCSLHYFQEQVTYANETAFIIYSNKVKRMYFSAVVTKDYIGKGFAYLLNFIALVEISPGGDLENEKREKKKLLFL